MTAVKAAYHEVEKLVDTFKVVALARGRDVDYVKETFLRLTFSGLLQTCVDRALKAVEDGDFHNGDPVVDCARQLLKEDLFLGTEDVSFENERCCGDFVKAYMQDVEFPEYLDGTTIYRRWVWFLRAKGDTEAYFQIFTVETLKINIKVKLEAIERVTRHAGKEAVFDLGMFLDMHPWEGWDEESSTESKEKDEDSDDDDESEDESEDDEYFSEESVENEYEYYGLVGPSEEWDEEEEESSDERDEEEEDSDESSEK